MAYREAIKSSVDHKYTHKKQTGGKGQFAHVEIEFMPKEDGIGFEFLDEIKGGNIPREFIPSVGKGIESALDQGTASGAIPLRALSLAFTMASTTTWTPTRSRSRSRGRMAFREAARRANPVLMEPIMAVESHYAPRSTWAT